MDLKDVNISTDKSKLNTQLIYNFLRQSYWAKGIPLSTVQTSIEHSVCFAAFYQGHQIAFARVVTDCATFAYLADVFVLPEYEGKGVGKKLIEVIMDDERFYAVRRFLLATRDAHSLYEKFGFTVISDEDQQKFMQVRPLTHY